MIVKATEMAKAVRVAIDQNKESSRLLLEDDTDTLSLDEIIYSKLADAVRLVEIEAPSIMLEPGHELGGSIHIDAKSGKGFMVLPRDFMRLISFRMSDWSRTVYDALTESDSEYKLQTSRWRGIYGSPEKPVVAIVQRSEGTVLEFYSCRDKDAYVAQGSYLPLPRIDKGGGIDVSEKCYRAAIYRAASLAMASIGDQLSGTMLEISRGLLAG